MFSSNISFPKSSFLKIQETISVISQALKKYQGSIGICFNGGKDSVVLLDIISRYKVANGIDDHVAYFHFQTNYEFPEMLEYFKKAEDYWKIKMSHVQCNSIIDGLSKAIASHNTRAMFIGVRENDPEGKSLHFTEPTTEGWPSVMRIHPLLKWSYKDIWNYIETLNIPVCKLYERGYTSIGSTLDTQPNPMLKDSNGEYMHAKFLGDERYERAGRHSEEHH